MKKKKMFNQNKRDLEYREDYSIYKISIDFTEMYGLNTFREYDKKLGEKIGKIEPTGKPVLFQITSDFSVLEELADEKEKNLFYLTLTNLLMSHLFDGNKRTEHERRMTPLKMLNKTRMSNLVKTDLGNRVLKFPVFGVEFADKEGKMVYEVII